MESVQSKQEKARAVALIAAGGLVLGKAAWGK